MELSKEEQEAIKNLKLFLQKEENYMTNDKLEIILNLISKLQKENEKQGKVIDRCIEEIHSILNLGEFIDNNINKLDRKDEIKNYIYKNV